MTLSLADSSEKSEYNCFILCIGFTEGAAYFYLIWDIVSLAQGIGSCYVVSEVLTKQLLRGSSDGRKSNY